MKPKDSRPHQMETPADNDEETAIHMNATPSGDSAIYIKAISTNSR